MIFLNQKSMLEFFARRCKKDDWYHASLFLISSTLDKLGLLLDLASLLLCQNKRDKSFCGICPACIKVRAKIHPDIWITEPGEKKSIGIDQIREISQQAQTKPWEAKYKIFILLEVHLLREEAANALLKTLEEPPPSTLFFLTAVNENTVIPTILSRCQIFFLGEESNDPLQTLIKEHSFTEAEAQTILALAEGSLVGALEIKTKHWERRKQMMRFFVDRKDPIQASAKILEMCGEGEECRRNSLVLIEYILSFLRDVLVCKSMEENSAIPFFINRDMTEEIQRMAAKLCFHEVEQWIKFLLQTQNMIHGNVSPALVWENIYFLQQERRQS